MDHVKNWMDLPQVAESSLTPGTKEYDLFNSMSTSSKQKRLRYVCACVRESNTKSLPQSVEGYSNHAHTKMLCYHFFNSMIILYGVIES